MRALLTPLLFPLCLLAPAKPTIGHAAEFSRGADVGWLPQMEASGFVFRDRDHRPGDCLKILRDHGINTLRLRVFVNPSQHPRSGHCSRDEVVALAEQAGRMGFRIMINFHYSDTWADPAHQNKPAAWADHDFEELKRDVSRHTRDVLGALKVKGVIPEWVQVGNEISNGMLWPDGGFDHAKNLAELINAGHQAVKSIDPRIKVIVQLDRGNDNRLYRTFFDAMKQHGANYDVIGMSYYPYWLHEDYTRSIGDLGRNLNDMVTRYGRQVMVVEVGGEDRQVENTRAMLAAVLKATRAVPENHGLGVIYWEPQGAASWSQYKLSCWNADGTPTAAMQAFVEDARSGSQTRSN